MAGRSGNANSNFKNIDLTVQNSIIFDYISGMTINQIREKYSIGTIVFNRILSENNIKKRDFKDPMVIKRKSDHMKKWMAKPEIKQLMKDIHVGSKRSEGCKKLMSERAHNRMDNHENRFKSKIETAIADYLIDRGFDIQKQYKINGKGHPYDMYIGNKVLIEFDGPAHTDPNYWFHKKNPGSWEKQQLRDQNRLDNATKNGYKIYILTYDDLKYHTKPLLKYDLIQVLAGLSGFQLI